MYLSHLASLTEKEKKYAARKCVEMQKEVAELTWRQRKHLEVKTGIKIMDHMKDPKFTLKPEYGFSLGAVLNLIKIVKQLEKDNGRKSFRR